MEVRGKKSISLVVRALRRVREVESYVLSKFQPPTTLGDSQKVEKRFGKISIFGDLGNQFFVIFPGFWKS